MLRKYIREIELSGALLLVIGVILSAIIGINFGAWPCGIGLFLLLVSYIYKAFHWQDFERENKQNLIILTIAILLLLIQMIFRK
jgi:hypothetical protein